MPSIIIEKRKYPRTDGGRTEVEPLDEDDFGHWFFAPAGVGNRHTLDGVLLLPTSGQWWVAWWWAEQDPLCTVDVVTPPRLEDDVWIYDDLEIDLAMRQSDRVVHVVDLDEFAESVSAVPYPASLVEGAITGMRSVERKMILGEPPFDLGFDRLQRAVDRKR